MKSEIVRHEVVIRLNFRTLKVFGATALGVLLGVGLHAGALAAQSAGLTLFEAGGPISVSEVNGNFQHLDEGITNIDARLSPFESSITVDPESGNVGIGLEDPEAALEIEGDLILNGTGGVWVDRPFEELNDFVMHSTRQNKYRRFGRTVCAVFAAKRLEDSNISGGEVLRGFPVPTEEVFFAGYGYHPGYVGLGLMLKSDGTLFLEAASNTTHWVQGSVCYEAKM